VADLSEALRPLIAELVREEVARLLGDSQRSEYLTSAAAAELAQVTQATIRRWVREGRLTACGAGKDLRIVRAELEKLMRPGKRVVRRTRPGRGRGETPEILALRALGLAA
jgi:excisionase family DNA binding protein